jgi:hypothetical protein
MLCFRVFDDEQENDTDNEDDLEQNYGQYQQQPSNGL